MSPQTKPHPYQANTWNRYRLEWDAATGLFRTLIDGELMEELPLGGMAVVPIPEPVRWIQLGSGLALLAVLGQRRQPDGARDRTPAEPERPLVDVVSSGTR